MKKMLTLTALMLITPMVVRADTVQDIEAWWKERTQWFATSESSPLAAIASYYLKPGERLAVDVRDAGARATEPISHGIVAEYTGKDFRTEIVNCGAVSLNGTAQSASARAVVILGHEDELKADGLILRFSRQGNTGRVMAFQQGTEKQRDFNGFVRYAVDVRYRMTLPLTLLKAPEKVTMGTSQGLIKAFERVGYFDFDMAGQKFRLYVYRPEGATEDDFFLPFKDGNAGIETYMAGRYVDPVAARDNLYTVDFNLAYNPMCAFSPYYNCARPPSENCVAAKITAGEKALAKH